MSLPSSVVDEAEALAPDDIEGRLAALLDQVDPRRSPRDELWGAQFDLGLAWPQFPLGHGGVDADERTARRINEGLFAAGFPSPAPFNPMGIGMAGPTVVAHGSDEHRERLLRPCFTCEDLWCQLFSEPGAGSDLANLSTSAVRDGDTWLVSGQKVWTSMAQHARWGLLLTRSDPKAPKHRGLTYFILDMHAPGIEVRPIRQIDGSAEFNEVFLTEVRIPDSERLGDVGDGWRVALTTLMNERVLLGGPTGAPTGSGHIAAALKSWAERRVDEPVRRDELMRLWIRAELLRLTSARAAQNRRAGVPGPEGSIGKLAAAELEQDIYEFCVDLLGAEGTLWPDSPEVLNGYATQDGSADPRATFLFSRHTTIAGGTSEVMRNILGERVLGLPGDVRVDRDLPWNETAR